MHYFKKPNTSDVFAYETLQERQDFGDDDLVEMTNLEVDAHLAPQPQMGSVPQVVTRFQARAALHLSGLLPQIEALMADAATPVLSRLAWQDALEFQRTSPTVLTMAAALGLTDAQVDALFITAAGIEA